MTIPTEVAARNGAYRPIESDAEFTRYYIPMPGGWEVQTKGHGSTFRLCDPKGDRLPIPDSPYLHEALERMARDANAEWGALWSAAAASESALTKTSARLPDGYAYVYPANGGGETIRVGSNGREINGTAPIRAIPYYFDYPKEPAEPVASVPDGCPQGEVSCDDCGGREFGVYNKSAAVLFCHGCGQFTTLKPTNQEGAAPSTLAGFGPMPSVDLSGLTILDGEEEENHHGQ